MKDRKTKGGTRKPTGALIALINNTDPTKEAEFNKWYNEVHLPRVLDTGCYYYGARFENPNPKPGEARYLAYYETDWEDPIAAYDELMKLAGDWVFWPHLEQVCVQGFKYIMDRRAE